ncbi:MAG: TonB-dependent siderophore receptor [Planctomycetes bacterium]|nr:TonB-dependent siderophore receptor [Planctomycetota bacterium]
MFDWQRILFMGIVMLVSTASLAIAEEPAKTSPVESEKQPPATVKSEEKTFEKKTVESKDAKDKDKEKPKKSPQEIEITVTGALDKQAYRAKTAPSVTRTDTPVFDTPASVQTVTRQVIEDQSMDRLSDAYRNVSSVQRQKSEGFAQTFEAAYIRGFANGRMLLNGFPVTGIAPVNMADVERVEVLKGPASMVYGLIEPGGTINVVTKKPEEKQRISMTTEAGTYDQYHETVDATGPITKDKKLLFRVVANYDHDRSFRDWVVSRRYEIAPSIEWRPSKDTSLNVEVNYSGNKRTTDDGVAFSSRNKPVAGIETFLGEPGQDDGQDMGDLSFSYRLEHRFNEALTVRNMFLYRSWIDQMDGLRRFNATLANNSVSRFWEKGRFTEQEYQSITDVVFKFNLGPTKHQLLGGVDFRKQDATSENVRFNLPAAFNVNIIHPRHGLPTNPRFNTIAYSDSQTPWVAAYLQDEIELVPDDVLRLLIGERFDYIEQHSFRKIPAPILRDNQYNDAFTGRVGLMYHPIKMMGVYGSVSQSYDPVNPLSKTFDGSYLANETGIQYEAGLKFETFEKRLLSTMSVFKVTKDNVVQNDPLHTGFSLNAGTLRSQGFEFDISGEFHKGWNIIANYAFTETDVIKASGVAGAPKVGQPFINIPNHSGSIWVKYMIQSGMAKDLGFGMGVYSSSDRSGDSLNTFRLPGYTTANLAAFYRHSLPGGHNIKAQLNVTNIFDRVFYESSLINSRVQPGEPRSASLTLGFDF